MSTCVFFKVRGHVITLCVFHDSYDGRQRGGLFVTESLQHFNIPFCSLSVPSLFYIQNVTLITPRVMILIHVDGKQTSYGSGITTLLLQPTFTFFKLHKYFCTWNDLCSFLTEITDWFALICKKKTKKKNIWTLDNVSILCKARFTAHPKELDANVIILHIQINRIYCMYIRST